MRSSTDRAADDDILLSAVLPKQDHRRREEDHIFRRTRRLCQRLDPLVKRRARPFKQHRALMALLLRAAVIQRQIQHRRLVTELLHPISLLRRQIPAAHPLAVVLILALLRR